MTHKTDMVERVAAAICKSRGHEPYEQGKTSKGLACKYAWVVFVPDAKAALTELLEPTEGMCLALVEHGYVEAEDLEPALVPSIAFSAAIQAALEGK